MKAIFGLGRRLTAIFFMCGTEEGSGITDLAVLIDSLIFELRASFYAMFFDTGDRIGFLLNI